MTPWMIWFNDDKEAQGLYQWELDQLKCLGEFTLEEIAAKTQNEPVLGFIPSEQVSFVETVLPKTSEKRLRLALPSLVEDQIASNAEDNFYALPLAHQAGEATVVGVISHAYLQNIINACQQAGINLQSLSTDCFLLPTPTEGVSKMIFGDRVIVRSSALHGFAMKQEHAVLIMKELESVIPSEPGLFEAAPFNFLQAQFLIKPSKKPLGRLQWIYITLGLALVLHLLALIIMGSVLNHRLSVLKEKTLALYSQVVPGATKVSSAKSLIERELKTLDAGAYDPLLDLLASLSAALTKTPGAVLNNIDYHQNRLSVNLTLPNMDSAELLDQALRQSQTPPHDQQITEQGNAVLVQFTLSTGESR